jgi:serine/threonine protein kinase
VLVDNLGIIKLSDFGASKKIMLTFDESTGDYNDALTKSIMGSPYWMAPEVVNKTGHGKPADIWSLGCCVLEMLTAKAPWSEHGNDSKVIMDIIAKSGKPPNYPKKISIECSQFLDYCFQQE